MPRNCCPPSRRGHTWDKPALSDVLGQRRHADSDPAIRICKRCGQIGRVNKQGVIYAVEAA